ncbi:uncharacterized protein LOC142566309 isoform X2 [Dermacentor variabilis]|uniref:uncharacterized protein LOC142566309 isoform X2 n=1 Tax=Dermacentor variabilis TaxID=34621 RepID=UPI003F5BED5E
MLLQRPQQTNSLMPSISVPRSNQEICNGKPFRVFQRQCLRLVTAAPSYRLRKPRGRGGKCRQPAHLEQPP